MITAKAKKPTAVDPTATKNGNGTLHNQSQSESDSSIKTNLDPETRKMLQTVVKIKKELMKKMKDFGPDSSDQEIDYILRGYVGQCGETAQIFIDRQEFPIAEKILRSCEQMLKTKLPVELVAKTGLLYQVNNNMANLSNRTGDVEASVKYLQAALDCTTDPRLLSKEDLPIAETLLNLANANIYLGKYEIGHKYADEAYQFAATTGDKFESMLRGCEKKRATLGESHPDVVQMEAHHQNLLEQFQGQINLKILAKLATGQAFEKMERFDSAIREFRIGTQLIERNFGTQHHMYTVLANAMGGAKLKTKFQTKEMVHKVKTPPKRKSPPKEDPKREKQSSKIMLKRLRPGSAKLPTRRNIAKIAKQANLVDYNRKAALIGEVRMHSRPGQRDNLFMTNCNQWTKVHCHKPRPHSRSQSARSLRSSVSHASRRNFQLPPIQIKKQGGCEYHSRSHRSPTPKRSHKHSERHSRKKHRHATSKKKDKKNGSTRKKHHEPDFSRDEHDASLNIEIKGSTIKSQTLDQSTDKEKKHVKKVIIQKESNNCDNCSCHSGGSSAGYLEQLKMMRQVQEDHMRTVQMVLQSKQQRVQEHQNHAQCCLPPPWGHPYYMPYPWGMVPHPAYAGAFASSSEESSDSRESRSHSRSRRHSRTSSRGTGSTDQDDLNDREMYHHKQKSRSYKQSSKHASNDYSRQDLHKSSSKKRSNTSVHKSDHSQASPNHEYEESPKKKQASFFEVVKQTTFVDEKANVKEESFESLGDRMAQTSPARQNPRSSLKKKDYQSGELKRESSEYIQNPQRKQSQTSISSHNTSFRTKSQRSFRAPSEHSRGLTRREAAVIVQKLWRGYAARIDRRLKQTKTRVLFQTMYKNIDDETSIVTCKVESGGNVAHALHFFVRTGRRHDNFVIDLSSFGVVDMFELHEKVIALLENCERVGSASEDIKRAFDQPQAQKCLGSNRFSPSVFKSKGKQNFFKSESKTELNDNQFLTSEEVGSGYVESNTVEEANNPDEKTITEQRREQMEAEFNFIKEQVSGRPFVLNTVEVLDHEPRFMKQVDSQANFQDDEISLLDECDASKNQYLKPVVIEKITVNRKFHRRNRSGSVDSEHSYKVFLGDYNVLWSDENVKVDDQTFFCQLIKNEFLNYELQAQGPANFQVTKIKYLPFEEHEASEQTADFLILAQEQGTITKLDLRKPKLRPTGFNEPSFLSSVSRASSRRRDTLSRQSNYSKIVRYMFNFKMFDEEYHAEITKQFTDSYKLNCYVLQCDNPSNKQNMDIEVFRTNTEEFINRYVENNLKIYWKMPKQEKANMAFIAINYSKQLLSGQDIKRDSFDKRSKEFTIIQNGEEYYVTVNTEKGKGIFIKCVNDDKTDECLLQINKLDGIDEQNIASFIKQRLEIVIDENYFIAQLSLNGFCTDDDMVIEEQEQSFIQQPDNTAWKVLYEESIQQANTKLKSQLCVPRSTAPISDDAAPFKVQMYHCNLKEVIGELLLSVPMCTDLLQRAKTFEEGVLIDPKELDKSPLKGGVLQTQAVIPQIRNDKKSWQEVLKHAVFFQSVRQIRFGIPQIGMNSEKDNSFEMPQLDVEIDDMVVATKHDDCHLRLLKESNASILDFEQNEEEAGFGSTPKNVSLEKSVRFDQNVNKEPTRHRSQSPEIKTSLKTQKIGKRPNVIKAFTDEESVQIDTSSSPPRGSFNMQARTTALRAIKESRKAQMSDEGEDEGPVITKGDVKCEDVKDFWITFRLSCTDQDANQFKLGVAPKMGKKKSALISQQLDHDYVRSVLGNDRLYDDETIEKLDRLKKDLLPRLRANGALIQRGGKLPREFFESKKIRKSYQETPKRIDSEDVGDFNFDDKQRSMVATSEEEGVNNVNRAQNDMQKKLEAIRAAKQQNYQSQLLSQTEPSMSESDGPKPVETKGKIKCDNSDSLWMDYTIRFDPQHSQVTLTASIFKGNSLCRRQPLSSKYVKNVLEGRDADDEHEKLRRLKNDIEMRLKVFGKDYEKTTIRQFPDEFFSKPIPKKNLV